MARKITLADLQRVVAAESRAAMPRQLTDQEYAGRLWLRLGGIDPDAVPVPPEDAIDARALEKAREVIVRRFSEDLVERQRGIAPQLARWRDRLNGQ